MKLAQNILLALLTIVAVGGAFIAVANGVDKHLETECIGWIEEYEENRNNDLYYWTEWQVAQCEAEVDYTFDGVIK